MSGTSDSGEDFSWSPKHAKSKKSFHHSYLIDDEITTKINQLSSFILGTEQNLKNISSQINDYKEEQSTQNNVIFQLRQDLDLCLNQLGTDNNKSTGPFNLKSVHQHSEPFFISGQVPIAVPQQKSQAIQAKLEHINEKKEIETSALLTDVVTEMRTLLHQLWETIASHGTSNKADSLNNLSSESSVITLTEKNKEIMEKDHMMASLKAKAQRIIRQWKEKCQNYQERIQQKTKDLQKVEEDRDELLKKYNQLEENFHQCQLEHCKLRRENEIIKIQKHECETIRKQWKISQEKVSELDEKIQREREFQDKESCKSKEELVQYQNELSFVKESLNKYKSQSILLSQQAERSLEELTALQENHKTLKSQLELEKEKSKEQIQKIQELDKELEAAKEEKMNTCNDHRKLLHYIHCEVNLMVGLLARDKPENIPSLSSKLHVPNSQQVLADIQSKLAWSLEEITSLVTQREQIRRIDHHKSHHKSSPQLRRYQKKVQYCDSSDESSYEAKPVSPKKLVYQHTSDIQADKNNFNKSK